MSPHMRRFLIAAALWLAGVAFVACLALWPFVTVLVASFVLGGGGVLTLIVVLVLATVDWIQDAPESSPVAQPGSARDGVTNTYQKEQS